MWIVIVSFIDKTDGITNLILMLKFKDKNDKI